jgi:hypothetical protein
VSVGVGGLGVEEEVPHKFRSDCPHSPPGPFSSLLGSISLRFPELLGSVGCGFGIGWRQVLTGDIQERGMCPKAGPVTWGRVKSCCLGDHQAWDP